MTPTADGFLFSGPTYDSSDIVFSENTCLHMACWRAGVLLNLINGRLYFHISKEIE
jgi:hypothetical protein